MRLVQFLDGAGNRCVGRVAGDGGRLERIDGTDRVYHLALEAARSGLHLEAVVAARASGRFEDYDEIIAGKRLLPPLDHPDPAHWLVTGTGLSHLGSASARDAMHAKLQQADEQLTDSMKMFKWGMEGGKPAAGAVGTPPEWFYKGDGRWVVAPEQELELPAFAKDGGEEVEVCGLYVIADDGSPLRVGFALANEYSDHVTERENYLYLAHSKLRQSSYGPEVLVGELPRSVQGTARLLRGGETIWSSDWLSGEDNMCHSVANLEHHHFKYRQFRSPGDVHVHYFGAATGSFTKGVETKYGDVFEISAEGFGRPLRNTLGPAVESLHHVAVRTL
ncbi:MAG: FAH family protein [Betaproteobacteria bacterium]|nr:FAH family protein [Betaproteobacteria bacterium]